MGVKFALRVPRPGHEGALDPFSFPSLHTALLAALMWFLPPLPAAALTVIGGALRVAAGVHSWLDVAGGALAGVLVPPAYFWLRSRIGREADRKAFHMGASALFALLFYCAPHAAIPVLGLLLLVGAFLYAVRETPFVRSFLDVYDRGEAGAGAFTLVLGLFIVSLLDAAFVWKAALFVGYVDGFASIIGNLFGARRKSIYGALGGLLGGAWAAACTDLSVLHIAAAVLAENIARRPLDDNVLIPVSLYAADAARRFADYMQSAISLAMW